MTIWATVLAFLAAGDALVLREKAGVAGRYVRLLDLLDADRLGEAARMELGEVYLGCAPEEGKSRTITAEEIRKELQISLGALHTYCSRLHKKLNADDRVGLVLKVVRFVLSGRACH